MSSENIITKNHCNGIIADKVGTNDKGLCKSVRAWLYSIGKMYTELMSIPQKLMESWGILRCGNDQDITDPCVHQYGHGIVDHRFVINR